MGHSARAWCIASCIHHIYGVLNNKLHHIVLFSLFYDIEHKKTTEIQQLREAIFFAFYRYVF